MTTADIQFRLLSSLFPPKAKSFLDAYKTKPDLYGPLWIYTTLIIVLAISGNLYRYTQMKDKFTYNYEFVPVAAAVIYSIGIGFPLAMKFLMRILGSQFFNGTFIEVTYYCLKCI